MIQKIIGFDPSQPSVAFYIETSHLIYTVNQIASFYVKPSNVLKWVNSAYRILVNSWI